MANRYDTEDENPIDPWAYEACVLHGDVTAKDRIERLTELVDRLEESTTIPKTHAREVANEVQNIHDDEIAMLMARTGVSDKAGNALMNAMDRLLTAWSHSPTEIDQDLTEYREELEAIKASVET